MNFKFAEILKNFAFISILLGCIGILISNIHLNSYNIPVFDSFDSRVIFIGFVFTLFFIGHALIYSMFFNYKELHNNNFLVVIFTTFLKVIVISNFILFFCFNDLNSITKGLSSFWSRTIQVGIIISLSVISIIGIGYQYIKNDRDKFSLMFKILLVITLASSIIIFIYLYLKVPILKDILKFEQYFAMFFLILFMNIVATEKDIKKGLKVHSDTFFSSDTNSRNIFDKIFIYFYLITILLILTNSYTNNIYKHIDKNKGGGKFEKVSILIKNDTINGNLVMQSSKYIILEKDSMVIKLDWDKVDKIKINKK